MDVMTYSPISDPTAGGAYFRKPDGGYWSERVSNATTPVSVSVYRLLTCRFRASRIYSSPWETPGVVTSKFIFSMWVKEIPN